MRRALIVTVAATVSMVLLAMLVPMGVLVRNYALEDRLSRAALEVQATETVVSGGDKGSVAVYLDRLNARDGGIQTTVLYPDGTGVGPHPGEDEYVAQARATGQARLDDISGGTRILVPVSLGGSSALPEQTPVIRVDVREAAFPSAVHLAWLVLALLGLLILAGAVLLADRLGRSFVRPIQRLAADAQRLGGPGGVRVVPVEGPPEVRELARSLNRLVERIEVLLERERESVADLSHRLRTPITSLRLGIDALPDAEDRDRLGADVDRLQAMVDHVIREARRSQREGVAARTPAVGVLTEQASYWLALAEEQGRRFDLVTADGEAEVGASEEDLRALVDVLLDNVFSHTAAGTPLRVTVSRVGDGVRLLVEDGGPGFPPGVDPTDRGSSGAGSTGLGLAIAESTARSAGGSLSLGRSELGGAAVTVDLA